MWNSDVDPHQLDADPDPGSASKNGSGSDSNKEKYKFFTTFFPIKISMLLKMT